jgi:hypothetical protein
VFCSIVPVFAVFYVKKKGGGGWGGGGPQKHSLLAADASISKMTELGCKTSRLAFKGTKNI